MTTAKEWREGGAGRALGVSITNRAPYPSCQISTKALFNCICPVFKPLQVYPVLGNKHTYMCVSVCIQQCTEKATRSLMPLSNIGGTSRKRQGSLKSIFTFPF